MTRQSILLISDTHIPARAPRLPRGVVEAITEVDLVVHAGDWVDVGTLDMVERLSPRFIGVYGNNDHGVLRERLAEVARFELDGLRFAVIHETGAATGREKRADVAFPDADVLIFGHSHIPWDSVTPRGMRLLNPGSPTDRRRQPRCTLMVVTVEDGAITDVEVRTVERDFTAEPPDS